MHYEYSRRPNDCDPMIVSGSGALHVILVNTVLICFLFVITQQTQY